MSMVERQPKEGTEVRERVREVRDKSSYMYVEINWRKKHASACRETRRAVGQLRMPGFEA